MTTTGQQELLRLTVLDSEDLGVVSALLQDAESTVGDMAYLPQQARFAMVVSRFDWPAVMEGRFERCRAGLHFERVLHVARSNLPTDEPDTMSWLLALAFTPTDPPAGTVLLTFIGGAQIKLTVECLEAEMRDIGPRWAVAEKPTLPVVAAAPASP